MSGKYYYLSIVIGEKQPTIKSEHTLQGFLNTEYI